MKLPEVKTIPGVYCSTGEASCADLDFSKLCTCPVCPVFVEYKLRVYDPDLLEGYYCGDGNAV